MQWMANIPSFPQLPSPSLTEVFRLFFSVDQNPDSQEEVKFYPKENAKWTSYFCLRGCQTSCGEEWKRCPHSLTLNSLIIPVFSHWPSSPNRKTVPSLHDLFPKWHTACLSGNVIGWRGTNKRSLSSSSFYSGGKTAFVICPFKQGREQEGLKSWCKIRTLPASWAIKSLPSTFQPNKTLYTFIL